MKQERFLRDQNKLIDETIKSFRSLICQTNVLRAVAKVMGVESKRDADVSELLAPPEYKQA